MANPIRFTRLDNHTIEDGQLRIVVTLYCARNDQGQWFIGNIYVNEVTGQPDAEYADITAWQFVKNWFGLSQEHRSEDQRNRFVLLCAKLDAAELSQRSRGEVLEIH